MTPNHSHWTVPSLHRYRPAVLALTALVAGCTIYYIHESFWSTAQDPSKGPPLRRSNARRRRGSRILQRDNTTEQRFPALDFLTSEEERGRVYGWHHLTRYNGNSQAFSLQRDLFGALNRTLEAQLSPRLAEEEVARARDEIPAAFLNLYFYRHLGPPQEIDATSRQRIISALEQDGFSRESIDNALITHRDGQTIEHIHRWIRDQLQIPNLSIETVVRDRELIAGWHRDNQILVEETDSEPSLQGEDGEEGSSGHGQDLLNLLFRIAEESARREGYIHRGITCNGCSAHPIKGIRYRCVNCVDYDLCEICESLQIHPKTHLFYKVRIPRSHLGHQPQELKYPGKYAKYSRSLSRLVVKKFCEQTDYRQSEIEGFWEQFRCLAAVDWPNDPNHFNLAIDHRAFEQMFMPTNSTRPPPPNLIYDRVFSFYDTDNNNLIGFEEFIMGLSNLNKKGPKEKWKRIFRGFDIDGDGFVNRKDFLRMFKAHYSLTKEMTAEIIAGMEEESNEEDLRELITGGHPLSSAFTHSVPAGQIPKIHEGKALDSFGDVVIHDHKGALEDEDDDNEDNEDIIAQHADEKAFGNTPLTSYKSNNVQTLIERIYEDPWPPAAVQQEDIIDALRDFYNPSHVKDEKDRMKIRRACHRRLAQDLQYRHYVGWQAVRDRRNRSLFYPEERKYDLPVKKISGDDSEQPDTLMSRTPSVAGYQRLVNSNEIYEGFVDALTSLIADLRWPFPESRRHFRQCLQTMAYKGWSGAEMVENLKCYSLQTQEIHNFITKFLELIDAFTPSPPLEDGMEEPAPPSRRSRSSSKVRFEDGLTTDDDGQDTRSITSVSSRSIPVNERWGGYEIPEPEEDVGREILYQVTQEALNEVIDPIFRLREELWLTAQATKERRQRHRAAICAAVTRAEYVNEFLQRFLRETRIKQNYPPKGDSAEECEAYVFRDFICSSERKDRDPLTSEDCTSCKNSKILLIHDFCKCGAPSTQYKQLHHEEKTLHTERCMVCLERGESIQIKAEKCCAQCGNPGTTLRQEEARLWEILSGDGGLRKGGESSDVDELAELIKDFINNDDGQAKEATAGEEDTDAYRLSFDEAQMPVADKPRTDDLVEEGDIPLNPNLDSEANGAISMAYPDAAIDLHESVRVYNEADASIEQKIAEKPLDKLLEESGYEIIDETPSNNGQHSPARSSSPPWPRISSNSTNLALDSDLISPDPTLPQNRPNTTTETAIPVPKVKPKGKASSHASLKKTRDAAIDKDTLLFWAALYLLEAEDEERGGPGRLNENEFLEIMLGERGKSMEFVGEWMNLTAF